MYLVGDNFCVSFKWVAIIRTMQEAAHTHSAKVSTCYTLWHFGDWSLITGRGATKQQGGQVKLYPYKRVGGAEKGSFHVKCCIWKKHKSRRSVLDLGDTFFLVYWTYL